MLSVQMSLNKRSEPHPYLCMIVYCVVPVCVHLYAQAFVVARVCARMGGVQHVASSISSDFLLMLGKSDKAGRSGTGVKRGSECFPHGSRRSQKERKAWKWDEMNWSGRKGDRRVRRKKRISENTHKAFSCARCRSGNRLALRFEDCHSAPVHLKSMRKSMHDCKHIRLRKGCMMWDRLHSFSWLVGVRQDWHIG